MAQTIYIVNEKTGNQLAIDLREYLIEANREEKLSVREILEIIIENVKFEED